LNSTGEVGSGNKNGKKPGFLPPEYLSDEN